MTTTTKTDKKATTVVTPEFRASFPAVFAPRAIDPTQEAKYSIVMLFPKATNINALKLLVKEALIAKWGGDQTKYPKGLRLPFRDGDTMDKEETKGMVVCSATSKQKPGVVDQKVQPILEPSEFYGGCWARATVTAFAYDKAGNKGVALGLRNVQKVKDDTPFSGRNKPEDDFDAIPMPGGAEGGTAGGEDVLGGIGV